MIKVLVLFSIAYGLSQEANVPAWSTDIANELIRMASADGGAFDQMQLQELVYIAHGWCLAMTGEPLTGDRPEALEHGPEYRRLADALATSGVEPVISEIKPRPEKSITSKTDATRDPSTLLSTEHEILARVYTEYGSFHLSQLAALTRAEGTPWDRIFADGAGKGRDVPHKLIRDQFVQLAANTGRPASPT